MHLSPASKPWVNGDKAGASHTSLGTSHLAPAANCARESHGNCDDASDFVKSQSDLTAGTTGYQEAEAAEKKKNSAGTTSWIFTGSRPPAGQEIAISDSERRAQADTKEIGGVEGVQIGEDTWLTNVIGGSSEGGAFFNLSWWLGAGVTHCGRLKEEDRERERRRLSQRDYGKRARGVPRLDLSAESVRKPATREGVCASGHGQRGVVLTQEELERYNWIMDIGEPRTSGSEFTKSSGTQDAPSDGTPRARLAEVRRLFPSLMPALDSTVVVYTRPVNSVFPSAPFFHAHEGYANSLDCSIVLPGTGTCTGRARSQSIGKQREGGGQWQNQTRASQNVTSFLFTMARVSGRPRSLRLSF